MLVDAGALADARSTAGIGRYTRGLLRALGELAEDRIELVVAQPHRPPLRESRPLRFLHAQPGLLVAAARRRPDVVHGLGGDPCMGVPASRRVVTLHDVVPWAQSSRCASSAVGRAYFAVQAVRIRRCAAVITPSAAVAGEASELLGIDPARVTIVPEGVDAVFTPPAASEPSPDTGLETRGDTIGDVLWVGSLRSRDPRKALDVLVAALADARGRQPPLRLVLVGSTGAEAERVLALARGVGVDVLLCGYVSDAELAALFRRALVAVVPSLHEGFGLPALEAMACGAPLVAASAGNLPDLVGDAGLLVPPGDPRALADALARVCEDDGLRRRLAAAGPARAAAFTWERTAAATLAVYERVAGGV